VQWGFVANHSSNRWQNLLQHLFEGATAFTRAGGIKTSLLTRQIATKQNPVWAQYPRRTAMRLSEIQG